MHKVVARLAEFYQPKSFLIQFYLMDGILEREGEDHRRRS